MWHEGQIAIPPSNIIYKYQAKVYDIGSEHGINQGRVSKLMIRQNKDNKIVFNWDRGMDIDCETDEVRKVLEVILTKFS